MENCAGRTLARQMEEVGSIWSSVPDGRRSCSLVEDLLSWPIHEMLRDLFPELLLHWSPVHQSRGRGGEGGKGRSAQNFISTAGLAQVNVINCQFFFVWRTHFENLHPDSLDKTIQWSLIITNSKGPPKFVLCNRSSY